MKPSQSRTKYSTKSKSNNSWRRQEKERSGPRKCGNNRRKCWLISSRRSSRKKSKKTSKEKNTNGPSRKQGNKPKQTTRKSPKSWSKMRNLQTPLKRKSSLTIRQASRHPTMITSLLLPPLSRRSNSSSRTSKLSWRETCRSCKYSRTLLI